MFIREDLEKAIKDKFKIEKLVYQGTGENASNDCNLLLFDTGKDILAIEFRLHKKRDMERCRSLAWTIVIEITTTFTTSKNFPTRLDVSSESKQKLVVCMRSEDKLTYKRRAMLQNSRERHSILLRNSLYWL